MSVVTISVTPESAAPPCPTSTSSSKLGSSSAARQTYKLNGLLCQWVDKYQRSRWPPCRSLFVSFSDGLRFVALAERFCGRPASGVVEDPRLEGDKVGNLTIAVSMFEHKIGFHLRGVDTKAIAQGSATMISAFLSWIVLQFDGSSELATLCKQSDVGSIITKDERSPVAGLKLDTSGRKLYSKPTVLSISSHNLLPSAAAATPAQSSQQQGSLPSKSGPGGLLSNRQKTLLTGGSGGGIGSGGGGMLMSKSGPARPLVMKRRNESARNLKVLPKDLSDVANMIIECDLSCNALAEIPEELCRSQELEKLDLTDNRVSLLKSDSFTASFPHLSTLRLSLNPIKEFPVEVFHLPELHELLLHHCQIDKISFPEEDDSEKEVAPLQMLDLSSNKLKSLPSLNMFRKLITIRVSDNELTALPPLIGFTNLRELNANNNKIDTFPTLAPSLRCVDLSCNNLTSVPAEAFLMNCEYFLQTLLLQKNSIKSVCGKLLHLLPHAKVIDLTENQLTEVPPLNHEQLEGFYCAANKLSELKIERAPMLLYLDISRNALKHTPENLAGLSKLSMLGVSFNPLEEAPRILPKQISDLHMACCGLKSIPNYGLEKVEMLLLHSNELKSMRVQDIIRPEAMNTLKFVDLSHNYLNEAEVVSAFSERNDIELYAKPRRTEGDMPNWGEASTCGRRKTMEDAVFEFELGNLHVFGLFDGHGGSDVSTKSSEFVSGYLREHLPGSCKTDEEAQRVISESFAEANKLFTVTDMAHIQGSTALVCAVVDNKRLHVGSIGDSRAVLCHSDGKVVRVSFDHKPREWNELDRVHSCGGHVTPEGRIQGLLSVARALGDKALAPYVCADPFLASYDMTTASHLIIACDGVWDVVSDEEACAVVSSSLAKYSNPKMAAAALRDYAYLNGSGDNISVIVAKCPPLPSK